MKRRPRFVLLLFMLSILGGYLLSKASWVGRAGISLFYQQYSFLKVWWQGGLLVFAVWMILFYLQERAQQKLQPRVSTLVNAGAIAVALIGLYFTYQDFRHSTAHRWLGERFHLGGYLFWIGWLLISAFYLTEKKTISSAASFASKGTSSVTANTGA